MKYRVQIGMTTLLILVLCLAMLAPAALAAEPVGVEIPVSVALSGYELETPETYEIVLTAVTEGAPMPEGAVGGVSTTTVTGAGEASFAITFPKLGIYDYTVHQTAGTSELGTYDETVYNVRVFVTNSEDYTSFVTTVIVYAEDETQKLDAIVFNNFYKVPPVDLTVKKVWVDDGKDRPTSVTIQLKNGDEVVETITLSESNKWTYTWEKLDGEGVWSIVEANVPKEYKASYKTSGDVVTVTNTRSLIQTGQLNWPIPVLACVGVIFFGFGFALLRRKERTDA